MNGKKARELRKIASLLCDKTCGDMVTKWYRKLTGSTDGEGKPEVQITGSVSWHPKSYMATYRRLKKEYMQTKRAIL